MGWDSITASSLETGFSASASAADVSAARVVTGGSTAVAPSGEVELFGVMGLAVSMVGSAAVIG